MEGKVECNLCGEIRHLRPGGVLLCEYCDLYKVMANHDPAPKGAGPEPGTQAWWSRYWKDKRG